MIRRYSLQHGQPKRLSIHFKSDGTWFFSDNADGSGPSATYTYTVTDGKLVGSFTNPGVGDGQIEATVTGDTLALTFIEFWHDPHKVVPYAGTRL